MNMYNNKKRKIYWQNHIYVNFKKVYVRISTYKIKTATETSSKSFDSYIISFLYMRNLKKMSYA
jgi:hypothetical protein